MRDQLVRYLLGELNAQEREQLEAALRDSPELQREFAHLKKCLPAPEECDSLQHGSENAEFDRFDEESFDGGQFEDGNFEISTTRTLKTKTSIARPQPAPAAD
jgi:hypothetical protein